MDVAFFTLGAVIACLISHESFVMFGMWGENIHVSKSANRKVCGRTCCGAGMLSVWLARLILLSILACYGFIKKACLVLAFLWET